MVYNGTTDVSGVFQIGKLYPNHCFGAMLLYYEKDHGTGIKAETNLKCLRMNDLDFQRLVIPIIRSLDLYAERLRRFLDKIV